MKLPIPLVWMGAVLAAGCADNHFTLPPGQDRAQLVAAIAKRGNEDDSNTLTARAQAPGQSRTTKAGVTALKTTAKVSETFLLFVPGFVLDALNDWGKGNLDGASCDEDLTQSLADIWSED
jgi:hypothetical protein